MAVVAGTAHGDRMGMAAGIRHRRAVTGAYRRLRARMGSVAAGDRAGIGRLQQMGIGPVDVVMRASPVRTAGMAVITRRSRRAGVRVRRVIARLGAAQRAPGIHTAPVVQAAQKLAAKIWYLESG